MRWKQIASRFTGFSIPVFGVSWNPPKPEVELAQRLINYLEDRRVLFNPYEMEVPEHCVHSVLEIRGFLTDLLGELPKKDGISEHLRAMRAACRRFLDQTRPLQKHGPLGPNGWPLGLGLFGQALGEFRASIGFHAGVVALAHGLDVGKDLEAILPPAPRSDDA